MPAVRETITHLYSLGRFEDIRVDATPADGNRVELRFELSPVHPVTKIEFTGSLHAPGVDTGQMTKANLFQLPRGLSQERLYERRSLLADFDRLKNDLDASGVMETMDRYGQQAVDLVLGRRAQEAFDLSREPARVRDRYGKTQIVFAPEGGKRKVLVHRQSFLHHFK